jgi:1-acyl-sn-glycerol-3-phosphate acyltransferase
MTAPSGALRTGPRGFPWHPLRDEARRRALPFRRVARAAALVRAATRAARAHDRTMSGAFGLVAATAPTLPTSHDRSRIYALSRLFADLCAAHDWRIRVRGPVPAGPVLLVSNHVSYLDALVLAGLVPAVPVAKLEVSRWPLIGGVARRHGVLFVDRGDAGSGARVLRRARRALASGLSVLNFPEGTTSSGEQVLPFRRGIFGLARIASVPVVPVALRFDDPDLAWHGDALFLPHYLRLLHRGETTVRVRFGGPLTPERYGSAADLAGEAQAAVEHLLGLD